MHLKLKTLLGIVLVFSGFFILPAFATMDLPQQIRFFDLEMPLRCQVDNFKEQSLSSTVVISPQDFIVRLPQKEQLPRYQVNSFSSRKQPVEVAIQNLLSEAGIQVVAEPGVYPVVTLKSLKGELSNVLEGIVDKAGIFYSYDAEQKILVMNFSVNFSMVSMYVEFPMLIYNIFNHFMPSTLQSNAFEINEEISLNARAEELQVKSSNSNKFNEKFTSFPQTLVLTQPGSYTVTQTLLSGQIQTEQFFVKIPASESNICKVEDELDELIVPKKKAIENLDLLLYFAAALVALVILERWLQAQDM